MSRPHLYRPPLVPDRVRSIGAQGFAFVPNHFLLGGFLAALQPDELLLYFFLVLAGDRLGTSFYHFDTICSLLALPVERYLGARNGLIEKDLIAFDGTRFQVLELPAQPPSVGRPLRTTEELERDDPATVRTLIRESWPAVNGAHRNLGDVVQLCLDDSDEQQ